jgi:hypothetical protein
MISCPAKEEQSLNVKYCILKTVTNRAFYGLIITKELIKEVAIMPGNMTIYLTKT